MQIKYSLVLLEENVNFPGQVLRIDCYNEIININYRDWSKETDSTLISAKLLRAFDRFQSQFSSPTQMLPVWAFLDSAGWKWILPRAFLTLDFLPVHNTSPPSHVHVCISTPAALLW